MANVAEQTLKPKVPTTQIVFGDIVYWVTVISCILAVVGPLISFIFMDGNVMNPHYLFDSIWDGDKPEVVWDKVAAQEPNGHFWIHNLTAGDGITQIGIVIGCAVGMPAMLVAAFLYWFKDKGRAQALMAMWVTALIIVSLLGILKTE